MEPTRPIWAEFMNGSSQRDDSFLNEDLILPDDDPEVSWALSVVQYGAETRASTSVLEPHDGDYEDIIHRLDPGLSEPGSSIEESCEAALSWQTQDYGDEEHGLQQTVDADPSTTRAGNAQTLRQTELFRQVQAQAQTIQYLRQALAEQSKTFEKASDVSRYRQTRDFEDDRRRFQQILPGLGGIAEETNARIQDTEAADEEPREASSQGTSATETEHAACQSVQCQDCMETIQSLRKMLAEQVSNAEEANHQALSKSVAYWQIQEHERTIQRLKQTLAEQTSAAEKSQENFHSELYARNREHQNELPQLRDMIPEEGPPVSELPETAQRQGDFDPELHVQLHGANTKEDKFLILSSDQEGSQESAIQLLRKQMKAKDAKFSTLAACFNEKDQELFASLEKNKVLTNHNKDLQARVTELESALLPSVQHASQDTKILLEDLEKLKAERVEMIETLQEVQEVLEMREFEVEHLGEVLEEQKQKLEKFDVCHPATLRSLLMMRHVEQASVEDVDEEASDYYGSMLTWVPTGLPQDQLDKRCSSNEIQRLAKLLPQGASFNNFYERLKLDICSVCSKAKFKVRLDTHPRHQSLKWLHEYVVPSRYFTCCEDKVCKKCFEKHILETVEFKWWNRLDTLQWFKCPRAGCEEALGIRCEADMYICLERILGRDADNSVKMYTKALAFRRALKALEPQPSEEALTKASNLTRALVASGHMYSPFDSRFDSKDPDETGCIPDFNPGTVYLAAVDHVSSPIPLFPKLFRRKSSPQECMTCSKRFFDIDYGSTHSWKSMCSNFPGPWVLGILLFPTSENQKCNHDFEVCRVCTAEYIRNVLVSGGPSACENVTCPQCNRKLMYEEIIQLTDSKTAAKYEKFLIQSYLSKEENFRWCLNPICTNGQLYDHSPFDPQITCEECDFEMCYQHSMPWHEGLTCAEYDSQRDHGDPSYAQTREWIRTNTKPCPNGDCRTDIQKGEACFHMTCTQCRHEFCWQCLASWSDINVRGQQGHNEGCFFRTSDIGPMGLRGENLEAALGD
ncbi:uncharacterized protein LY89DRAFT_626540 [Mollisia scopiformis]|uniref:RBR-type E3 ubiquitin transferase n=1 Tax=Mollisia scopiformis TaxID=149040 RepID=A0A194WSK4_MOLSC|nr:uncharacterized protein LY89DRAFT_626540 [Mollisia scopiformis]KUJ10938.1 hypothetical protein LY89DRAFT_626540 [Mollisia scopiformis]